MTPTALRAPAQLVLALPLPRAAKRSEHVARGEQPVRRGRRRARLREIDVLAIRALHDAGGITQHTLADAYSVSQGHVANIILGKRWAHVRVVGAAR